MIKIRLLKFFWIAVSISVIGGPCLAQPGPCWEYLDDPPTCQDSASQWEVELSAQLLCEGNCIIVGGIPKCPDAETELVLVPEMPINNMVSSATGFADKQMQDVVCVRKYTCICTPLANNIYNCNQVGSTVWEPWYEVTEVVGVGEEDCD